MKILKAIRKALKIHSPSETLFTIQVSGVDIAAEIEKRKKENPQFAETWERMKKAEGEKHGRK